MKLDDAISQYLLCCKVEKQLSEKTISAYKNDLKQFLVFCNKMDLQNISDIERDQLRLYIRDIIEKFKPKSQRRKIASVKAFFNWLEYEEIIDITPFRKIRIKINEGNRLPKTIPMSELKKLFGYIETGTHAGSDFLLLRNTALFELMFATGLRVGEISDLLYDNVDVSAGTIRIIGKGDKERLIPLCNKEALKAIKAYLKIRNSNFVSSGWFFLTRTGEKLQEQNIRLITHKYTSEAGISMNVTPHMFRHSFATYLLEQGVDIRYIQALLGHSNITTTQIYTTVNEKKQRELLTKFHPRRHISNYR